MFRRPLRCIVFTFSFLGACAAESCGADEVDPLHAEKMQRGLELYKSHIAPLLKDKCVACHGGDEVASGFDLATRKGLLRGGTRGGAVVPGKAEESRLVSLISHNEKPHMPEEEPKLAAEAIAAVRNWIDLGAPYGDPLVEKPRDPDAWVERRVPEDAKSFWAFRPLPKEVPLPATKAKASPYPIDAFILAALEAKGLSQNPPVDRRKLIRRATLDLIGLPPTPQEITAFLEDSDPQAYEKLIDRLLASPHFGERWGRYWLDTARFAESHGFEQDYDRPHAYHFRDFAIEALNRDLPYDQFVKWQLAGDEFAPQDPLALKATGFLGAGVFPTQITANEVEKSRYDALDDMAATTGSAFLALTVGCARCHDHKFDPIPQADYYRFTSTFTTTVRGNLDVNLDPQTYAAEKAKWDAAHAPLQAKLATFERDELPKRFAEWEAKSAADVKRQAWRTLTMSEMKSEGGATLTKQDDGSILASGKNPDFDTYTFTTELSLRGVTGVKLEALAHDSLVKKGPGRAANGNIALSDFRWEATAPDGTKLPLKLQNPQATFEQPNLFVRFAIDDDPKSSWAVDPQFGKDHAAVFELAEDYPHEAPCKLTFTLKFNNNNKHNIGRVRLSVISAPRPIGLAGTAIPENVAKALDRPAADRKPEEVKAILDWYKKNDSAWQIAQQPVADHLKLEPKAKTIKMMVCSEGVTPIRHHTQGADFFNEFYFLKRGDVTQKQGLAEPGFLQVLTASGETSSKWKIDPPAGSKLSYRRTALANWILDPENGAGDLAARVAVNRLWQGHFGKGLVATSNDFGVQGRKPSHPELLDWLAIDLQNHEWKLKRLHKLIMLSETYRQSCDFHPAAAKVDPENDLLWRRTPRRLEAEAIRDSILATSGRLDRTQFGPGSLDENHTRRSIYFTIKRSQLVASMQLFDQPEPLSSVGLRPSTTIAPQALAFLNGSQVRASAKSLAKIMLEAGSTPEARLAAGYNLVIGREPSAEEITDAQAFIKLQSESYVADKRPDPELSAWTDLAQVLYGLNDFIYVE